MKLWKRSQNKAIDEPIVRQDGDTVVYVLPVAHIQPNSLDVRVDGPHLHIDAMRMLPPTAGTYRERSLGVYSKSLLLPEMAIHEGISAHVANYSLTVRVPVGDDEGTAQAPVAVTVS